LEKAKEMPKEELRNELKTKWIYHYVDPYNNIDIRIRDVYKNESNNIAPNGIKNVYTGWAGGARIF